MDSLNNSTDVQKYLQSGPMTRPFLKDARLDKKIARASSDKEKIKVLLKYLHKHNHNAISDKFIKENKFKRTAEEIWQSGKMTGCTDWATTFATIARQYGISSSFFTTAEKEWSEKIANGEQMQGGRGHSFCECFVDGNWVLVDPTLSIVQEEYSTDNLHLTGKTHFVGGKKDFIPYKRDLDNGGRSNTREFNMNMMKTMYEMLNQKDDPKVEPVTKEELIEAEFDDNKEQIEIIQYDKKEDYLDQEKIQE